MKPLLEIFTAIICFSLACAILRLMWDKLPLGARNTIKQLAAAAIMLGLVMALLLGLTEIFSSGEVAMLVFFLAIAAIGWLTIERSKRKESNEKPIDKQP
jgi:hypothetical protein